MANAYKKHMKQEATYWSPPIKDEYDEGDFSQVTPVVILCRWQDKAVLFRDAQGRETISNSIVYPDRKLVNGGYLVLGDVGAVMGQEPLDFSGSREIRKLDTSPSLLSDIELQKAYL